MADRTRLLAAGSVAIASFVLLYWNVIYELVDDWRTDDNYSHGFLIVPLAAFFVWERRAKLAALQPAQSMVGLFAVLAGLLLLLAGLLGAELFLPRFSIVVVLAGAVLFLGGWGALKVLAFPIAFLLLMIPIPAILFNQVAFPLQLLASRAGETVMMAAGVPVLREGNVIILAHTTLEVAEACSGIRSLISLLTVGIIYGYFIDSRPTVRAVIALSTVPIAVFSNAARVAGTGLAAHYYGAEAATGFFHTFSGWLVFVVAFGMLFVFVWLLQRLVPAAGRQPVPVA